MSKNIHTALEALDTYRSMIADHFAICEMLPPIVTRDGTERDMMELRHGYHAQDTAKRAWQQLYGNTADPSNPAKYSAADLLNGAKERIQKIMDTHAEQRSEHDLDTDALYLKLSAELAECEAYEAAARAYWIFAESMFTAVTGETFKYEPYQSTGRQVASNLNQSQWANITQAIQARKAAAAE